MLIKKNLYEVREMLFTSDTNNRAMPIENIKFAVTELAKELKPISEEMSEILNTVGKGASLIEHVGEINIELGNTEQGLQAELQTIRKIVNEQIEKVRELHEKCIKLTKEYNDIAYKSTEMRSAAKNLLHQIESSTGYETEEVGILSSKMVIKMDEEGKPIKKLGWNRYLDEAVKKLESEVDGS
jgi:uncharacterized coiled-coil DUF342 family protein